MKLNGWQRLGIITSLLWIPCAYVYTLDAVYSRDSNLAVKVLMACEDNVARGIGSQEVCDRDYSSSTDVFFREDRKVAALVALVPVPCAWVLVYLITYLVGWVRRGFKQPTPVTASATALVSVPQVEQVPRGVMAAGPATAAGTISALGEQNKKYVMEDRVKKLGAGLILLSLVMPTYYTLIHGSISEFISRMTSPLALLLLISGIVLSVWKTKKA